MLRPAAGSLLMLLVACGESVVPPQPVAGDACAQREGELVSSTGKIDVGGFALYADIQGLRRPGDPTIVFDAGAGEDHAPWQAEGVQQQLAQSHLTMAYDRAGLGESDDSGLPKTAVEQARQLHTLLRNSGLPPPYLLVSHSLSGMTARVFADLYPDELHGVVFVDSSHEGMNEGTWLPITIVDVTSSGEVTYPEFTQTVDQAVDARSRDRLRDKPISVLTATCHGACVAGISIVDESGWKEFQADIASLSDNSVNTIAPPGSEHHLMTTQPQMVIDGICELLNR